MSQVPAVSAKQMAFIDRLMADRYGVAPVQLMEHAGHAVASCTRLQFRASDALDQPVLLLAGSGGNGGDALVAARLLHAWGAKPTVVLARPARQLEGLPADHLASVTACGIPVLDGATIPSLPDAAVIVDGLLGSGATGDPTGTIARLIGLANAHEARVLAIDVPSGLDATTGVANDPCIVASATVTLGLPKTGLLELPAREVTGTLLLADIGIPAAAYGQIGVEVPVNLFSAAWLLPLSDVDGEPGGEA